MATYTTNYNLKKPATTEAYNIADFNGNADLIDAAIKAVDNKVDALPATDQQMNPSSTNPISNKAVVDYVQKFVEKAYKNYEIEPGDWDDDTTYDDFPHAAEIAVTGITAANYYAEIVFSPTDALSGNYAPVCNVVDGKIIIYASEVPDDTLTIPFVKVSFVGVWN